jgi:hypothetical protein
MKKIKYMGADLIFEDNALLRCEYTNPDLLAWQKQAEVQLKALTYLARRCRCGLVRPVHTPPYGSPITFALPHVQAAIPLVSPSTLYIRLSRKNLFYPHDNTRYIDDRLYSYALSTNDVVGLLTGKVKYSDYMRKPVINIIPAVRLGLHEKVDSILELMLDRPYYALAMLPGMQLYPAIHELLSIFCDYAWPTYFYKDTCGQDNHQDVEPRYRHCPLNYRIGTSESCSDPGFDAVKPQKIIYAYTRYENHILITVPDNCTTDAIRAISEAYRSFMNHNHINIDIKEFKKFSLGDTVNVLGARWQVGKPRLKYSVRGTEVLNVTVPYDDLLGITDDVHDNTLLSKYLSALRMMGIE